MQVTIYVYYIYIYFYNKIFLSSLFFWGDDPKGCCRSFPIFIEPPAVMTHRYYSTRRAAPPPKDLVATAAAPRQMGCSRFLDTCLLPEHVTWAQLGVNHKNVKDSGKNTKKQTIHCIAIKLDMFGLRSHLLFKPWPLPMHLGEQPLENPKLRCSKFQKQ